MAGKKSEFSVSQALAALPDDRLQRILTLRPDLAQPPPANFAKLAERLSNWPSIQACMALLDEGCVQVLHALCLLDQPPAPAELATFMGLPSVAGLERALDILGEQGLVFGAAGRVALLPGARAIRNPAGLGPPIGTALARIQARPLAELARRLDLGPPSGASREALLTLVAEALSDPSRVERALVGAPKGAADLARRMAQGPPEAVVTPTVHTADDRLPVGWLLNRGLVAVLSWDRVVMPREVGLALRGGRPFPEPVVDQPSVLSRPVDPGAIDGSAADAGLRLVADVAQLLDAWGEVPAKALKDGGLGVREVRRAAKLMGRDEVVAARIMELALAAGLAAMDYSEHAALPSSQLDRWLDLDAAGRWRWLVEAWLGWGYYLGLVGRPDDDGKPFPPLRRQYGDGRAIVRRAAMIEVLDQQPTGQAADLGSLERAVLWRSPTLWSGGPAAPGELARWVVEEAELLGLAALAALSGAGRLATDGDIDGAEADVRGRAPAVVKGFVIQADFTAVVAGQLDPAVRSQLDLLADVESTGAASVYRFSEGSLRRGFEAGLTATEVGGFLESHSERGVPQTLAYLVGDLGRRFGQLRVGPAGCYVRCDDPSLVAEILRAKKTARLGLRQLAPTVLAARADVATTLAGLAAAGYLPAQEGADGELVVARPVKRRAAPLAMRGAPPQRPSARVRTPFDDMDDMDDMDGLDYLEMLLAGVEGDDLDDCDCDDCRPDGVASQFPPPDLAAMLEDLSRDARSVVANLRAAGQPTDGRRSPAKASPAKAAPAKAKAIRLPGQTFLRVAGPEPERPTAIAKNLAAAVALLDHAAEQGWAVRVGYVNGRSSEANLNVFPLELDERSVLVEVPPECNLERLAFDQIVWVRILTTVEESELQE